MWGICFYTNSLWEYWISVIVFQYVWLIFSVVWFVIDSVVICTCVLPEWVTARRRDPEVWGTPRHLGRESRYMLWIWRVLRHHYDYRIWINLMSIGWSIFARTRGPTAAEPESIRIISIDSVALLFVTVQFAISLWWKGLVMLVDVCESAAQPLGSKLRQFRSSRAERLPGPISYFHIFPLWMRSFSENL